MRRVYDDSALNEIANKLEDAFRKIPADSVSEYNWGMYRAVVSKIKARLLNDVKGVQFGNVSHANGIGNNNAVEIIYTGNPQEQQICGLLHLNSDMYGGVFFYVTDIDGKRKTKSYIIHGLDKRDTYLMQRRRYAELSR